jgi:aspartate racemase
VRTVGILGGMGPGATVLLMQKIIAATPARDDADHVPLLVDQNTQVPSRIRHLIEGTGADPGPVLAAMARRLEAAGAEALAMPCNTAHHYAGAIRSAVSIPLIDMLALSAEHAARLAPAGGTVGVLASPAVRLTGLFDRALQGVGLKAIYAAGDDEVLPVIRQIKAEGPVDEARQALAKVSRGLLARGAAVQIVACTEFSLIAEAVDAGAVSFDTLDRLVEGILAFATNQPQTQPKAEPIPPTKGASAPSPLTNKETIP